jgi:nucleotide-binding universal stress UspA family protein
MGLVPAGIRRTIMAEATAATEARRRVAERDAEAAARELSRRGWRARALVRLGVPLDTLLATVDGEGADTLVLGARGVGGVERLLLGSVAEGALSRATVPLLIVK